MGVLQDFASFVGQEDVVVDPFEKMDAEFRFELLDLKGHGGLGIAKALGCLGKTVQFRDKDKGL